MHHVFFSYQQQHQAFVQHATQQLTLLENQKQQIEQQAIKAALAAQQKSAGPLPLLPELSGGPNNGIGQMNTHTLLNNNRGNERDAPIPSLLDQNINFNLLSGAIQNLQSLSAQGSQNNRGSDNGNSTVGADNRSGSYSV